MKDKRSYRENTPERGNTKSKSGIYSTAPYNFIPLNKKVIKSEPLPSFNTYHSDRYTGYIDLEIEAVTPLYIRDTLNDREIEQKIKRDEELKQGMKKEPFANPDFFSPGNQIRIPGSSLRGMIRTLVEIVSFGKFVNFDSERRFFYRALADRSLDLRNQYHSVMLEKINGAQAPKVKAGVIIKRGLKYFIKKSKIEEGLQYYRIEEYNALNSKLISEPMSVKKWFCINSNCKKKDEKYDKPGICPYCKSSLREKYEKNDKYKVGFVKIKFIPTAPKIHKHNRHNRHRRVSLYYGKVTQIWHFNDKTAPSEAKTGYLICTGWIGAGERRGKHLHWIINEPQEEEIEINEQIINDYKNDKWRDKESNVLSMLDNHSTNEVPVFYIERDGKLITFGNTPMFRLPYKHKVGDLVPQNLKDSSILDIAETIFGRIDERDAKKSFASRVFFEDAFIDETSLDLLNKEPKTPKILGEPKPTCFQHYITQNSYTVDDRGNYRGLKSYNDQNPIRGYKLYWHKEKDVGWEETNKNKISQHPTQYTKIKPIKEGAKFKGRIRFENLSKVELGALMFVLSLPEECCHKLGMAKPLGLGSIKIKPTLYISDRKKRYSELFYEWEDNPEESSDKEFIDAFQSYILTELKESFTDLWQHERLRKLKLMLNFKRKPKNEKTSYLDISEFRLRKVLPEPEEVIKE